MSQTVITKVDEVKLSEGWSEPEILPNGAMRWTKIDASATATICRLNGLPPVQVSSSFPPGGTITIYGTLAVVSP